ncbi:MAG: hypothetical protein II909_04520 [Kiritimatiellae bacterium]|nr:hypothetical protein [Kiritimatiellia bacterium]
MSANECAEGMARKSKVWPYYAMLALFFVFAVLLNVFSIPGHDELCCAFGGQSTAIHAEWPRVASLMDIVRQQYHDYMNANGRVFVHSITAFFAGFRLYYVFDILNVFVWFLFSYLLLKEAKVEIGPKRFACGNMIVFAFWWYDETVSMNIDFATDYLWMACATLAIMMAWRNMRSWWLILAAFIFGWGQETYTLPMVAALCGGVVVRSVKERRYAATIKQTVFLLAMIAGAVMLVMSPGIRARAGSSLDFSPAHFTLVVAKWGAGLVLAVWPALIFFMLAGLLWKNRRRIFAYLYEDLEWWIFIGASLGLSAITCESGLYRICSGWIMAGLILFLKDRKPEFLDAKGVRVFSFVALGWMAIATAIQVEYGLQNYRMLKIYKADPQGVTWRETIPSAFWDNIVSVGIYNHFHLNIFRLDCDKDVCPIILSGYFYMALYENPAEFFAKSIKDGEVYIDPKAEGIAVKIGKVRFSEEEKARLSARLKPKGWRRCLPGRLRTMFPSDAEYVNLPAPSKDQQISFIAKDGNWYTICKYTD